MQAVGLRLLDAEDNEINYVTLDSNTKFEIDAVVNIGTAGGITGFSAGPNYEYKFYLSRDGINFQQEISA